MDVSQKSTVQRSCKQSQKNAAASRLLPVALLLSAMVPSVCIAEDWPQWGGPNRDFKVSSPALAQSWPEQGPPTIWSRPLGDGYSAIIVEGGALFTMYRGSGAETKGKDIVIAADADTGQTLWEHGYDAPFPEKANLHYGPGPHATPMIVGQRLFAVGASGILSALDKETGKPLWTRDLYTEFAMPRVGMKTERGYSCSPIAYRDTVILPIGGQGQGVAAFSQTDGSLVWKSQDFEIAPSSPILINMDGEPQLVLFMAPGIMGLDPGNGKLLWSHSHRTEYDLNVSPPIWGGEDRLLFMSSAYDGGSRVVRLNRQEGKISVEEAWFSNRMKIHFGTAIRIGDVVYGSSGDFGPAFLMAVDVRTGEVLARQRGLAKANMIHADGKLLILDEDGNLSLGAPSASGIEVISKAQIFDARAWTVPTLAGTRLFLRDRKSMLALDLSP